MLHPSTTLLWIGPEIGFGVFATEWIAAGTITWARCALDRVSDDAARRLIRGDAARYLNHACAPNCVGTPFGFEVAIADLAPGAHLAIDYAAAMHGDDAPFDCLCGASSCRGRITADPEERGWRAAHAKALALVREVEQPLWPALDPALLDRALVAAGLQTSRLAPTG